MHNKKKRRREHGHRPRLDQHSMAILNQAITARASGKPMADPLITPVIPTIKPYIPSTHTIGSIPCIAGEQSGSQPSEAVMVIPTLGEKIVIIKDIEKPTLGFPFGGVETGKGENGIIDKDRPCACRREILEEIFGIPETEFSEDKAQELGIVVGEKDLIGTIQKAHDHVVYIYTLSLPASCRSKLKPGKEQQVVLTVSPSKIDKFVEEDIFLNAHAQGWAMFKRRFN